MIIALIVALVVVLAVVAVLALQKKPQSDSQQRSPELQSPRPGTSAKPQAQAQAPAAAERPSPSAKADTGEELQPLSIPPAGSDEQETLKPTAEAEAGAPTEETAVLVPAAEASGREARSTGAPPPSRAAMAHARDVDGLRRGLAKSREDGGFFSKLKALFAGKREIAPELLSQLEEVLLTSDVGLATTQLLLDRVRDSLERGDLKDEERVWACLREEATRVLDMGGRAGTFQLVAKPTVVFLVGVNGAGKTTTAGKLAARLQAGGRKCVLAAGDTFRAAAVQQLAVWGRRIDCEVVSGKDGADPGSVVFDAIKRAQEVGADVVLVDTAGRLHTKTNLMAELKKVARTATKALDGAPHEVLLVIDATNGQNALAQAKEFSEALELTGVVLTKLDGTAKGGIVLGISDALKLPVRFIGLGERAEDLRDFVPEEFTEALLGSDAR